MLDIKTIIADIDKAVEVVKGLGPIASALGLESVNQVADIAGAVEDIAQNALDRVEDIAGAVTSDDKAALAASLAKLRALNDAEDAAAQVD